MLGPLVVSALGAAGKLASGLMSAQARRAEFDENIRAMRMRRDQIVGRALAISGSMGATGASTENYLRHLTGEFDREIGSMLQAQKTTFRANILGTLFGGVQDATKVGRMFLSASGELK